MWKWNKDRPVDREKFPSVLRNESDRINNIVNLFLAHPVWEGDSSEAWTKDFVFLEKRSFNQLTPVCGQPQEQVSERARARAASTRLNPKQIIQQGTHKVVVKIASRILVLNKEGEDR